MFKWFNCAFSMTNCSSYLMSRRPFCRCPKQTSIKATSRSWDSSLHPGALLTLTNCMGLSRESAKLRMIPRLRRASSLLMIIIRLMATQKTWLSSWALKRISTRIYKTHDSLPMIWVKVGDASQPTPISNWRAAVCRRSVATARQPPAPASRKWSGAPCSTSARFQTTQRRSPCRARRRDGLQRVPRPSITEYKWLKIKL